MELGKASSLASDSLSVSTILWAFLTLLILAVLDIWIFIEEPNNQAPSPLIGTATNQEIQTDTSIASVAGKIADSAP